MKFTTLLLDVGGVILTNGWDRTMRKKATEVFHLNEEEVNERHSLMFDTYESGKVTLDQYLDFVIFYQTRSFSKEQFKDFMFIQSQSYPEMLNLIRQIKGKNHLKVVLLSNEGKELTLHRINTFKLKEIADFFIFSCFVNMCKPDPAIFQLALNLLQSQPQEIIYIDDRAPFAELAKHMGMQSIHHITFEETKQKLVELTSR